MALSAVSLTLNIAGTAAALSGYGELFRNITFFDQDKLENNTKPFDFLRNGGGAGIFGGLPLYGSAVLSGNIEQSGKLCDFPIESGTYISDHKIRLPRQIKCDIAVPQFLGGRVIDELNDYYHKSKKVVIQCTSGIFRNMILESMPVELKVSTISRPVYSLHFKEVIIIEPNYDGGETGTPDNAADGSTRKVSVISDYITKIPGAGETLDFFGSL